MRPRRTGTSKPRIKSRYGALRSRTPGVCRFSQIAGPWSLIDGMVPNLIKWTGPPARLSRSRAAGSRKVRIRFRRRREFERFQVYELPSSLERRCRNFRPRSTASTIARRPQRITVRTGSFVGAFSRRPFHAIELGVAIKPAKEALRIDLRKPGAPRFLRGAAPISTGPGKWGKLCAHRS